MEPSSSTGSARGRSEVAQVVERNIDALLARRRLEDQRRSPEERLAARVTAFTGSMRFVWIHLAAFGLWIVVNLPGSPWRFDPSYVTLAMVASVEAIFLSTFVLIAQNRMAAGAERRAELDLQMGLLAEHEVTRLIRLVAAMADRMGIEESRSPDLPELARDVAPEQVLDSLDRAERGEATQPPPGP
jgi:uncharacterized membrane protein